MFEKITFIFVLVDTFKNENDINQISLKLINYLLKSINSLGFIIKSINGL